LNAGSFIVDIAGIDGIAFCNKDPSSKPAVHELEEVIGAALWLSSFLYYFSLLSFSISEPCKLLFHQSCPDRVCFET
jgi:hypothetical protein